MARMTGCEMRTPFDFTGKVALVTGGASGLGLATSHRLAAGGARVIVNDLDVHAAEEAAAGLAGSGHCGVGGDVSDEGDVGAFVGAGLRLDGHIDILVNNAGIPDSFTPTVDQSLDHWRRLIDVHMTGTFLVSKTVAPHMISAGGGAIVNLNSIAGVLGLPVRTAYSSAKAGIGMLTRVLGCEWARHGIRVNAVAPGYIMTPLQQKLLDEGKVDGRRVRRRTPMGRFGMPEEVADTIAFLASPLASYITGVTLAIDGGYTAFGAASDAYDLPEETNL
jgi:NAD(P)-dependent dehydrogenase (short-subunit alcohol dehydrogenase family)